MTQVCASPEFTFCDLLIVDEMLPCDFSPFRTIEYSHYLQHFAASRLVCTQGWHSWVSNLHFHEHLAGSKLAAELKERIHPFAFFGSIVPRLAYITFLHNASQVLPVLTERRIPFVLQLYPGGGFEPNVQASDAKLKEIVDSPLCRKIIVTQNLSRNYLLERMHCDPDKIELIYGGVYDTRHDFDFTRDKQRYGQHKDTIDICFVAHRYGNDTKKKGYDQFVAVAKALSARYEQVRFHVVGDYTPDQIPLEDAQTKVIFHGKQPNTFFADFYPRMDMILSVNRPTEGGTGAFDGFPTGACMEAGFRGVLNCISDPLNMNVAFTDDLNFVLVDLDTEKTIRRLAALIDDPDRLYRLAYSNWKKFLEVFDTDYQLWRRTRLVTAELLKQEALVVRPTANRSRMDSSFYTGSREVDRRYENLASEYHKLATGYEALQADYLQVIEFHEQRHDNLFAEYQKLAAGFEQIQAENASLVQSVGALNVNLDRLQHDLHEVRSGAEESAALNDAVVQAEVASRVTQEMAKTIAVGRLERSLIRLLRSRYAMSIRTGYSRLGGRRSKINIQNENEA